MATRLYMVANSTPPVTPDKDAWTQTTGAVLRMLDTVKDASVETLGPLAMPANGGESGLVAQFVSPPLEAQTISGTVTVEFRAREHSTQDNVNKRWRSVRVINSAGVTVATLDTLVATTSTTELSATTIQGQVHANGSGFTSYTCAAGDRLLVAIGYGTSAGGTTPEVTCEWGGTGTDHAVANSDTTGTVPWVEFSQNLVFQATTTSVSSDLDMRWRVANSVSKDADIRWRVTSSVSSDLDLRYRITNRVTADLDTRWRVANRVTADADLRWRVAQEVSSDVDLRWRVLPSLAQVSSDLDIRWRVLAAVSRDLDARWRVLGLAATDLDLRWRVNGVVATQVSNDLDLRYRVLGLVVKDADLRWRVAQAVSNGLDVRWRVRSVVANDAGLMWRVRNLVSADADLRWRVLAEVARDLDLRWLVLGTVVVDLQLLWTTNGSPDPLPADVFVDLTAPVIGVGLDPTVVVVLLDPLRAKGSDLEVDRISVDLDRL